MIRCAQVEGLSRAEGERCSSEGTHFLAADGRRVPGSGLFCCAHAEAICKAFNASPDVGEVWSAEKRREPVARRKVSAAGMPIVLRIPAGVRIRIESAA